MSAEVGEILTAKGSPYNPRGCTPEMRLWVRQRDGGQCQFHEYKEVDGKLQFIQCPARGSQRLRLEVHHIYPQYLQKVQPMRYGGENPYNLITLCSGMKGAVGHHDLMQPTMIIAKVTYAQDRWSYERWIKFAHEALEKGMSTYNPEHDGMLKQIASVNTKKFLEAGGPPFPQRKGYYARA